MAHCMRSGLSYAACHRVSRSLLELRHILPRCNGHTLTHTHTRTTSHAARILPLEATRPRLAPIAVHTSNQTTWRAGLGGASGCRRGAATASEILLRRRVSDSANFVIHEDASVDQAIARIGGGRAHALVVVSKSTNRVVGIVTARDLLRCIQTHAKDAAALSSLPIVAAMTPSASVVHVAPNDSLTQCALLMSECKVSHLPVVSNGEVQGIISLQDISDLTLESARGGKDAVVRRVLPRRGISAETTVSSSRHHAALAPLFLRTGAAALPRPPIRQVSPSEDACFVLHTMWPGYGVQAPVHTAGVQPVPGAPAAAGHVVTYLGVADGVGSWHERGIDPRLFARRLMESAAQYVWQRAQKQDTPPSTLDVLVAAWETVQQEKVIGSATASIVALDCVQNQLSITGLGDCGVVLLRDTDIDRVGTLLRGGTQSGIRAGWRVTARATQQLKGFNMPYQLGYAPGFEDKFEKPWQGETLTLPVHPEDIVIAASDGLYDNLDEVDILSVVEQWDRVDIERRRAQQVEERRKGRVLADANAVKPGASTRANTLPYLVEGRSKGADLLAHMLVAQARDYSLDRMRDGPFARLAKENDVIWTKGGRPDDTTVVVARVSRNEPADPVEIPHATSEVDVTEEAIRKLQDVDTQQPAAVDVIPARMSAMASA